VERHVFDVIVIQVKYVQKNHRLQSNVFIERETRLKIERNSGVGDGKQMQWAEGK